MGCVLCLSILFFVFGGAEAIHQECIGEYCFAVPDSPLPMALSNAADWCSNNSRSLLEMGNSKGVQRGVQQFVNSSSVQNYFNGSDVIISARRETYRAQYTWVNGIGQSGTTVRSEKYYEADYYAYGFLIRTESAVQVYAWPSTNKANYICEYSGDSPSVDCIFRSNSHCFQSYNDSITWFEARNRCFLRGGDLAVFDYINSDPGLQQLSGTWIQLRVSYWVGIRRVWWNWISTTADIQLTNFADGKPSVYSLECLCLASSTRWEQWTDCNCNSQYPFICYKVAPSTSGATTSSSSTTSTTTKSSSSSPPSSATTATKSSSSSSPPSSTSTTTKSPVTTTTSSSSPILASISTSSSPGGSSSPAMSTISTMSSTSNPPSAVGGSDPSALPFPSSSSSTRMGETEKSVEVTPSGADGNQSTTSAYSTFPVIPVAIGVGVGGALCLIVLIVIIAICCRRYRKKKHEYEDVKYPPGISTVVQERHKNDYNTLRSVDEMSHPYEKIYKENDNDDDYGDDEKKPEYDYI